MSQLKRENNTEGEVYWPEEQDAAVCHCVGM